MKKCNVFKQLVELGEVKEEKHYKFLLSSIEVDKEITIHVPNLRNLRVKDMCFDKDIIDKLIIYKWVDRSGGEWFNIRFCIGRIRVGSISCKADLYINFDKIRYMNIEALNDFYIRHNSPELLEVAEVDAVC